MGTCEGSATQALEATRCGSFDFARRLASLRMTLHSVRGFEPFEIQLLSYGRTGGPKAGSRASSPGEQAAACDYQKTRALGRGASRSLRLPKNSCAGPNAPNTKGNSCAGLNAPSGEN